MLKRSLFCAMLVATPAAASACEVVYIDTNRAVQILEAMGLTDVRANASQIQEWCPDGGAPVIFVARGHDGRSVDGVVCLDAHTGVVRFGP